MRVRRLGWAGVEVEQDGGTLLIDYVLDASQLPCATPRSLFPRAFQPASAVAAIVTHLHADHADPVAHAPALRATCFAASRRSVRPVRQRSSSCEGACRISTARA